MSERAPWYSYLPLLVFPFLIFAPIILSGKALFWGTPLTQFIPWWTWAWETISDGILPVWNDMLGMGAPLIANYQSALFYPPTWLYLLFYSLGGISAMAWFQAVMVVLHIAWASLGMALLIRQLRLGNLAQIIGGLAFGLSGYLVSRAGFLSINATVAWIPWIILGVTKLVEANARRLQSEGEKTNIGSGFTNTLISAYLLLVVCLALQLLAGHAQTTWYTILLALIWFLYLSISNPWVEQKVVDNPLTDSAESDLGQQDQNNAQLYAFRLRKIVANPTISGILILGTAIFIAIVFAAVQLLPTAEYLLQSQRSAAVDFEFAMSYSFWPWRFLSFVAPDLFGNPAVGDYWGFANYWEDAIYVGLIPIVLAVAALITRGKGVRDKSIVRPGFVNFLLTLILITFIIALGRNTPIFPWLYRHIPTFDMFQAPTRISIVAVFSLSILAGIGADSWYRPRERLLYWLRLGIMAAAAITIGAGLALLLSLSLSTGIRPSFIRATAMLGIWGIGLGILTLKAPHKIVGESERKWGWWQWAVVMWIGFDLIVAGWGLNPGVDLDVYRESSPTTADIKSMLNGGRLYLLAEDEEQLKFERFLRFDTFNPFNEGGEWQDLRAAQLPNVTVLDTIPSANNFDPLLPGRYVIWMEKLGEVDSETKNQMLNLMGVTVVETIDSNQPFGVRYDQRTANSRVGWSSCGIQVKSGDEALEMVIDMEVDLENKVILEGIADVCAPQDSADIRILSSAANRINLEFSSPDPGYLIIADVWYPGWRAYVDGTPFPLSRANYLFKAVSVPKGEHEVTVIYQPTLIYVGGALSGLALLGVLILVIYWLGKQRLQLKN
jgi:hypothetical protein